MIRLIVALDEQRGIAKHGGQPWSLPSDERYFSTQTKLYGARVLMGRTMFNLLGHPLPDRTNYVLSHQAIDAPDVINVANLSSFLSDTASNDLWVMGGASLYEQTLGYADELYITKIKANFDCDQFFPDFEDSFTQVQVSDLQTENGFIFTYTIYKNTK